MTESSLELNESGELTTVTGRLNGQLHALELTARLNATRFRQVWLQSPQYGQAVSRRSGEHELGLCAAAAYCKRRESSGRLLQRLA